MAYEGGCQCGRIRYRAEAPYARASICYCRMCQRAGAAPFMAFVRFRAAQVTWSSPAAIFASSNLVERGFCRDCGTPLSYRQINGPYLSLTTMSLDAPEAAPPDRRYSSGAEVSWCRAVGDLPEAEIDFGQVPAMVSHQHGDGPG